MARDKNTYPSLRIRLDGFLRRKSQDEALTPRDQKFMDWYLSNEGNKRFTLAKEIITAMLNGEFGERIQVAVEQGKADEAIEAAKDLISEFVIG